jgi:hypothetical protein
MLRQPGRRAGSAARRWRARASSWTSIMGNNFTLDQLAKAACVSRAHFARLFRISTGTTPMAYLLGLRIDTREAIAEPATARVRRRGGARLLRSEPFFAGISSQHRPDTARVRAHQFLFSLSPDHARRSAQPDR